MKTLAASEADFRTDDQDIVVIQDFWTTDVSGLYGSAGSGTPLLLRWTREDRRDPGVVGTESLSLDLPGIQPGKLYIMPSDDVRADYGMATLSKGQGARAVRLEGTVRVDEVTPTDVSVTLDLSARMARLDVNAEFEESIRGSYRLPKGAPLPAWASTR